MKKMEEKIKSLQYKTKANDVDEKGIVTVAVNGIGVKDSQNDISMPGSFNKTLKENIGRMRWFLNHRTDQLLGVPLSGKETEGNLVMVGQLNLEKQIINCLQRMAEHLNILLGSRPLKEILLIPVKCLNGV